MESGDDVELLLEPELEEMGGLSFSLSQPTPPEEELFQPTPRRLTRPAVEAARAEQGATTGPAGKAEAEGGVESYFATLKSRQPPQLTVPRNALHLPRQRAIAEDGFQDSGECQICFLPWTRTTTFAQCLFVSLFSKLESRQ